jgi:hypothetical protein
MIRSSCSRLSAAALAAAFACVSGCSVADNLSADEILTEVDAIVRLDGSGSGTRLRYEPEAEVSRWYTRALVMQPVRWPMIWLFGRTAPAELENPTGHVRDLLRELPDEIGSDLVLGAKAAIRCGWIAELDGNVHSRLVAIDGLAAAAIALDVPLFTGDLRRFFAPDDAAALAAARAGLQAGRPEVRSEQMAGTTALTPYADALQRLTAAPLADGIARLQLLEEMTALYVAERDAAIRPRVGDAVRGALRHVLEGALMRIVVDRAQDQVDLRLCAMERIRGLGGPRTVPLLLAAMAATPAQKARGESLFDPDWLVQLRLIHYCGQLRGELATTTVQLPGRQGFELVAPVDFLAVTILTQDDYYSKLRTPALAALTWSLQRPRLDPDIAWVREWHEQRR